MASPTAAELGAAYKEILDNGQSFTIDGTTYTRANAAKLYDAWQAALSDEARADGTRPLIRGVNLSNMGY
ncbi:MAG: hypothetical protein QGF59_25455, partial [Pirellulaceae bacterium]|nr:hypothetical protein [Pirellulaceae bacterium]